MTRKLSSLLGALLVCLAVGFAGLPAFASHLRGTSVSWAPTSTPGTVTFTVQYSQRASAGCDQGYTCVVGDTVAIPFSTGDGNSTTLEASITSVNTGLDFYSAIATYTYTYTSPGTYTAYYDQCCRVSTIATGANGNLRMETVVTPFGGISPPVTSMPAIITVPLQNTVNFQVNAFDASGNTLNYRLATTQEMYDLPSPSCAAEPPPGLSINSTTGAVTWDTTQITAAGCAFAAPQAGDIWPVQFMIEALDNGGNVVAKTPLDIIVEFISSTEALPTLTFSNPGPITVSAGTPISFTVAGNDTATGSLVTLNAAGIPLGATATNTNQSLTPPVSSTFSWTPTKAQAGASYVVSYSAMNDTYEEVIGSITINVTSTSPPVVSCPTSLTGSYSTPLTIPVTVSDPQGDAVAVAWSTDGNAVHTDNLAATTGTSNLSLSQTFTTLGAHTVSIIATDTDNASSSCSTPITVGQASQTISFPVLPNVIYGAPDVTLTATASSGQAVSYSASGSCQLVSGKIHATGIGSCSVTASQPGNTDYTAASPVLQQFTITKAAPTVVVSSSAPTTFVQNSVTFTATVSSPVSTPTGSVTFYVGNIALATVPLTSGVASYTTTALPTGADAVTARYLGDAEFLATPSNPVAETAQDFTIAVAANSPGSQSVNPGASPSYTLVVTPVGGTTLPNDITLAASGGSSSLQLSLNPASIAAGASSTRVTLQVAVPKTILAGNRDGDVGSGFGRKAVPISVALLFLPLFGTMRRNRRKLRGALTLAIVLLAGLALSGLSGCGSPSGYFGQQPETYTLTVTGTSGALTHSSNVTLTVE